MTTAELSPQPLAMMFDASRKASYLPQITEAVQAAGWLADGYDVEDYAIDDLDSNVGALIVVPNYEQQKGPYRGERLLESAYDLEVPIAVITKRFTNEWVRSSRSGILVSKENRQAIEPKLTSWLSKLALVKCSAGSTS